MYKSLLHCHVMNKLLLFFREESGNQFPYLHWRWLNSALFITFYGKPLRYVMCTFPVSITGVAEHV